ncbi:hypothetical protein SEA_DELIAN_55 [Gordonia phage Delian]|uniref:hypothetical protein n=1 Tax=Gordonia phage CaptainKirk2 TaxID=1887643 RepID=UPI00084EDA1D|nr:hypothetical protein BIZ76_gp52 [Gordonia phage CaptainKirk2]ATN90858.1 hypothetical protein SEA_LYSIDIOUS_53 [Gordonia phage Lysidious]QBG78525.1 hypothetical protein SEA_BARCO_50 [Gordonia phage Barco]QDB74555.1 hypothetical protein SEA_MELBA_51 [Gordonia phage Melba]QDK02265.1 hypothetical protein SEA_SAMBA_51 [Gordonia phage Samba]QGH77975.1 hypothetical protein SEA_DELIAN_55 [Gordonia phage Delian]QKO02370.1 hypothetical protein SEA_BLINGBLING_49 [Gordonia phage BlingBling]QNJ57949.1
MNSINSTVFVPGHNQLKRCRGCSALIFFAVTRDGRSIPVDHKPRPDGNLAIAPLQDGEKAPRATVIRPGQAAGMRAAGVPVFSPHWASCPEADSFRRRARARGARQKKGGRR